MHSMQGRRGERRTKFLHTKIFKAIVENFQNRSSPPHTDLVSDLDLPPFYRFFVVSWEVGTDNNPTRSLERYTTNK